MLDNEQTLEKANSWGFWGTLFWGLLIALSFIIVQTITAVAYFAIDQQSGDNLQMENFETFATDGDVLSICTFASFIVCCLLIIAAIASKRGAVFRDYLALRKIKWQLYLLGAVALSFLLLGVEVINWVFGRESVPDVMKVIYQTADSKIMLFFAIVVLAPLFEELFFRGFLYRGLLLESKETNLRVWATIVITSVAWAVIHLQYEAFEISVIFFMGIVLGAARWLTKSIYVPIALHALNNFISTVQVAYVSQTNDSTFPTVSLQWVIN